ncbi:MAG TPA: hypothetical protein VNF24_04745 [Candidatus Acidoferrales bacterium]|nr:hypothetical protein [Candidatus Acidoferrales bacterium]
MIAGQSSGQGAEPQALIDLGRPDTWPVTVRDLVEKVAEVARQWPEGQPGRTASDLRHGDIQLGEAAEVQLRQALSGLAVIAYQGTRLLPHEADGIRAGGLLPLSEDLRRKRMDQAAANYPDLLSAPEAESILASGPLSWQKGSSPYRLGVICVVAPVCAFTWDSHGFDELLGQWGGESIYWGADGGPAPAVQRLTAVSIPSIVEVAIPSGHMVGPGTLWPVMVGTLLELDSPFHEWHVRYSVPPASVLDIIQPGDERWAAGLSPPEIPPTHLDELPEKGV